MIDQFASHCQHLQELFIDGDDLETETDKKNLCDLAAKILYAQEDTKMN